MLRGIFVAAGACTALIFGTPSIGWATFTGDLVFCDTNRNGIYEPTLGETGIDGVTVRMVCRDRNGVQCLDRTTITGQTTTAEVGGLGNFYNLCGPLLAYDPLDPNDVKGRYLFNPWLINGAGDGCAQSPAPWACEITVDQTTLPPDCDELITPIEGVRPLDGNLDADFCDAADGPFPEGQVLGNLDGTFTCEERPDNALETGKYLPLLRSENCAVPNDFAFGPAGGVCGNDQIEGNEQCDGTDAGSCLGSCEPDCTCSPVCGDDVINGSEICDGAQTGTCLGGCEIDCTCSPVCGDGVVNGTESCDGSADSSCPGECQSDCSCPLCGDNVREGNEQCDGTDDGQCTAGACQTDCSCSVCGNDTIEQGEVCDGTADAACPGQCDNMCGCPVCGDGVTAGDEQCDGADDAACPGACQTAGGANECRCAACGDGVVNQASEQCDGVDATACPGACQPVGTATECQCAVCGNDVRESNEECDGVDDTACPANCLESSGAHGCRCAFCGDGLVNRPEETCDPGDVEICNNMTDDDNDGLVDCADLIDCPVGATTCGADCLPVTACEKPQSDPARIRFYDDDVSLDAFQMHAQFIPQTTVEPGIDGFQVQITNASGIVYTGFVRGSDIQAHPKGKKFKFRDRGARRGRGFRDGIYYLVIKYKPNANKYAFRLRAFGDFSAATVAEMTTHVVIGNDGASITAPWRKVRHGWFLSRHEFNNLP